MIPANLRLGREAVSAADLPGHGRVWLRWRLMDPGPTGVVCHAEYLGLQVAREGETAEAVLLRAPLPTGADEEQR